MELNENLFELKEMSNYDKIIDYLDNLDEDIEKTKSGKWVNKGKEGTHGEFKTKKAAREQQKAMFASGWKSEGLEETFKVVDKNGKKVPQGGGFTSKKEAEMFATQYGEKDLEVVKESFEDEHLGIKENIGSDIAEYQKWVDYDMKKYGKISDETNEKVRKAGLRIVKDKYDDYEVIPYEPIQESVQPATNWKEAFNALKNYPTYNGKFTRPCKIWDLGLTEDQQDKFLRLLNTSFLSNFWNENKELSKDIFQEGRMGGHLVLDNEEIVSKYKDVNSVQDCIEKKLWEEYDSDEDGNFDVDEIAEVRKEVHEEIAHDYETLKSFDERVDKLIEKLKEAIDGEVDYLEEDLEMKSKTPDNKGIRFIIKDNGDFTFISNNKEYNGHTDKPDDMIKDMGNLGFEVTEEETIRESLKEDIVKSIEPLDIDVDRELESIFVSDDKSFPYKMLSRLESDFKYILGTLRQNSPDRKLDLNVVNKYLWFNDIDKQIALMKGIYERLDEKPEWISEEEIEEYGNQLKEVIRTEKVEENLNEAMFKVGDVLKTKDGEEIKIKDVRIVKNAQTNSYEVAVQYTDKDGDKIVSVEEINKLLENLNEDLSAEDGPKAKDTGVAQLLIDAINGEWDTIKLYNDILVNAESYGYSDIADVIRDITNEENIHVGQLQKALESISPNVSFIEDGTKEAEAQLTDKEEAQQLQNYEEK